VNFRLAQKKKIPDSKGEWALLWVSPTKRSAEYNEEKERGLYGDEEKLGGE